MQQEWGHLRHAAGPGALQPQGNSTGPSDGVRDVLEGGRAQCCCLDLHRQRGEVEQVKGVRLLHPGVAGMLMEKQLPAYEGMDQVKLLLPSCGCVVTALLSVAETVGFNPARVEQLPLCCGQMTVPLCRIPHGEAGMLSHGSSDGDISPSPAAFQMGAFILAWVKRDDVVEQETHSGFYII